MPLTPEDVHNKQFTTVRLREGYDEEEVDAFLDEVEAELTRLIRENEELRAKLAAATCAAASAAAAPVPMRREPTPIPPPAPPQPALPAPLPAPLPVPQAPQFQAPGGDSAARVLALAQQTADQAIAEARSEANKIVGEARSRAEGLERDAQEKHRVAMGSLETARAALERKVDDLRAFEREYRQRLKSYLDGQMRQLEASGGDDNLASSMGGRSQLSPTGLSAPPPSPSAPPMPMQASLPPGMPPAPSPVGAGLNGGGMGSTGSFQSANNGTNAAALTQTMAPIRPQMPPPPMGGQQPPFMGAGNGLGQPSVPSQPSPMRGFLIDEDPDA